MTTNHRRTAVWIAAFPAVVGLVAAASMRVPPPAQLRIVVGAPAVEQQVIGDPAPPVEVAPVPEIPDPGPPAQATPPTPPAEDPITPTPQTLSPPEAPQEAPPAAPEVAADPQPAPTPPTSEEPVWVRTADGYCMRAYPWSLSPQMQLDPTCPAGQPTVTPTPVPDPSTLVSILDPATGRCYRTAQAYGAAMGHPTSDPECVTAPAPH